MLQGSSATVISKLTQGGLSKCAVDHVSSYQWSSVSELMFKPYLNAQHIQSTE